MTMCMDMSMFVCVSENVRMFICLIFFGGAGHAARLAGCQFPVQGLTPGHGSESAES